MKTNTLLLIGAGVLGVYMLTRPQTPALPVGYNPYVAPAYNPYLTNQQNPLAQQIQAGGSVLQGLGDILGNFFGD